jgi:hypothetical protein
LILLTRRLNIETSKKFATFGVESAPTFASLVCSEIVRLSLGISDATLLGFNCIVISVY